MRMRIPPELEQGLSTSIKEYSNPRIMAPLYCSMYAIFFGIVSRYHSVWVYFVPPVVGPIVTSIVLFLRPVNPYKNMLARLEGRSEDLAQSDPAARKLVSILMSAEGRRYVLKVGVVNSIVLFAIAWILTLAKIGGLDWTFSLDDVVVLSLFFAMASMGLQINVALRWAILRWRPSVPIATTESKLGHSNARFQCNGGRFILALILRFSAYLAIGRAILAIMMYTVGKLVLLDRAFVTLLFGLICFAVSWKLGFQGVGLKWQPNPPPDK